MDWTNTGYSREVVVNVVHQTNVDRLLGSLVGVQTSGLTIVENYNSDSRIQAKVTTIVAADQSDGYVANARLRIILNIPSENWSKELITGYVSDISETYESGYVKRQYTIEGTIWGLLNHKTSYNLVVEKGKKLIDVWSDIMKLRTKMQFDTVGAQNHTFGSTIVYEPGSTLSTVLFEISSGYNRMDSDGHGRVTLKRYTAPSKQKPDASRVIDFRDPRTLAMYPLSRSTSEYELPGQTIVVATVSEEKNGKTVQKTVVGYYWADASDPTSIQTRGWLNSRCDTYSGNSAKPSTEDLRAIAEKNFNKNRDKGIEWSATSVFADYHAGEVIYLIVPNTKDGTKETKKKVHITQVQTDLDAFTQELTMKEV